MKDDTKDFQDYNDGTGRRLQIETTVSRQVREQLGGMQIEIMRLNEEVKCLTAELDGVAKQHDALLKEKTDVR